MGQTSAESICRSNAGNFDDGLYLQARIGNVSVNCLVDTGANKCIIHPDKYCSISESLRPCLQSFDKSIMLANGHRIKSMGQVKLPLLIEGIGNVWQNFIIAETEEPVILGNDFLSMNKCLVDVARHCIHMAGKTINCMLESKIDSLFRLTLSEDVEVPADSEMILPGKVLGEVHTFPGCVIVEASPNSWNRGIIVAKALVEPRHSVVPVRVMNPSDRPIKLFCKTTLGYCYPVDDVVPLNQEPSVRLDRVCCGDNIEKDKLPPHVLPIWESCAGNLNSDQKSTVYSLLMSYVDLFAVDKLDRGKTSLVQHQIDTGTHPPIKQMPRRLPLSKREAEREEVDKMLSAGVIGPSSSPWASPVVLVTKKDGSIRYCIDYRRLNDVTLKDSYPLPHPQDCLEALRESRWFSTLDLQSGYWQIGMHPDDREKTAFASMSGLYQFCVMPFGLTNAPGTFERLMDKVMRGLQYDICLIYLDDIIVKSFTFDDHVKNLSLVFDRLREAKLKLSPKKCNLFQSEVSFLGHIVSREGISTDPKKISAVANWPVPTNIREVRSFVGFCSYYRKFIRNFASIAKPLHKLTEKGVKFVWDSACEEAFASLKRSLISSTMLAYPDPDKKFILDTDASGVAIRAVLSQEHDGEEKVVAYYSRSLTKQERRYCVTRRELLAIVDALKHFHVYLYGVHFTVRTDHGSLRWLLNFKNLEGQLARWNELLGTYNFDLLHRPGRLHGNADGLSRRPCGSCQYCQRVEVQSAKYIDPCVCRTINVDDKAYQPRTSGNWLEGKTSSELKEGQDSDPYIGVIKKWLQNSGIRPKWKAISHLSGHIKTYWAQWDRLVLHDGILYRKWWQTNSRDPTYQMVAPLALRELIMDQLHNKQGHLGVKRTIARLRRRFYWTGYKDDVVAWCQRCEVCQRRKSPVKRFKAPMQQYNVGVPFERIALDILGPLPESHQGNKYVLVISDYFTRWVEAFPMMNQEANTVADALVQGFISRFGVPGQIHSDQGAQFESNLFQSLCAILGIEKTRTTPYHPQSDGLVERFNKTLGDMLSKVVDTDHRNWDDVLLVLS